MKSNKKDFGRIREEFDAAVIPGTVREQEVNGVMVPVVDMALIQQGWSKNGNYYSLPVLQKLEALIDSQPKMFRNHLRAGQPKSDRQFQDWDGTIIAHKVANNRIEATVIIHDEKLEGQCRTVPQEVGASIDIFAKVKKGVAENREGIIVEEIQAYNSTDFVLFPSAGGRVLNLAADMNWEIDFDDPAAVKRAEGFFDKIQAMAIAEGVVRGGDDPLGIATKVNALTEGLKAMLAKTEANEKFWRLQDALRTALRTIGEDDELDEKKKKAAIDEVLDEFVVLAKGLDLVALFSNEYKRNKQGNAPGEGGEGSDMAIGSLAELKLQKDLAPFLEEYRKEVESGLENGAKQKAMAEEVTATKAKLEESEKTNRDLKSKLDAIEVERNKEARKALVETKLATLPEAARTDKFRAVLVEAKDEAEIDALIEDRKSVVGAAVKNPQRPANVPKTGEGAPDANGSAVKESVTDESAALAFR